MRRHSYGSIPKLLIALLLSALMVVGTPVTPALAAGVPTVGNVGSSVTADAGGAAVVISPNLTLSDFPDLSGASVTISTGFVAGEDVLGFTGQDGVSGSYNASTGRLTLSGLASSATYEAVLRSVTYQNTNPIGRNVRPIGITFSIDNGLAFYQVHPQIGHYYQYVAAPNSSWISAVDNARTRLFFGMRGYLVSITSSGENDVVASTLQGSAWMGASDASREREWRWVLGPEYLSSHFFYQNSRNGCSSPGGTSYGYTNWASNEPSGGCLEDSDYGYLSPDGLWHATTNLGSVEGYVVEYGGGQGDPNPVLRASTTVLVVPDRTPPASPLASLALPSKTGGGTAVPYRCSSAPPMLSLASLSFSTPSTAARPRPSTVPQRPSTSRPMATTASTTAPPTEPVT